MQNGTDQLHKGVNKHRKNTLELYKAAGCNVLDTLHLKAPSVVNNFFSLIFFDDDDDDE
jgi:hypothetical protein